MKCVSTSNFSIFLMVECNVGSMRDADSDECVFCPQGTYSDTVDASSCTPCPEGTTTRKSTFSQSVSACVGNKSYCINVSNFYILYIHINFYIIFILIT